jgi:hypothetical protein
LVQASAAVASLAQYQQTDHGDASHDQNCSRIAST